MLVATRGNTRCPNAGRELGLAIIEVGNHQAQAVEQVQQDRGCFKVKVAKLLGQSQVDLACGGGADDTNALGCLGRQFVRAEARFCYSHWKAVSEASELADDNDYAEMM